MPRPTVLLCMGTRSEVIKMAPVYRALAASPLRPVVVHTGPPADTAWPLYRFFGMAPDHTLALPRERPTLGRLDARLLDAVDGLIAQECASAVLVQGGASSALTMAMTAFYSGAPVGHVEAGLRSGDSTDPFSEETNRTVIARLARWHYAPTRRAVGNLMHEGIPVDEVDLVGDTVVDAVQHGLGVLGEGVLAPPGLPAEVGAWARRGRLALVTMGRRENWGRPIEAVAQAVGEAVAATPDLHVLWPVHPDPSVRAAVEAGMARARLGAAAERVRLVAPLDYPAMLWALRQAWIVLTDSGGVQEEAAALDRPVLVLRKTTERPELIEAGGGVLVGTDGPDVARWLRALLSCGEAYAAIRSEASPYGDGFAGERIAASLAAALLPAITSLPTLSSPRARQRSALATPVAALATPPAALAA